MVIINHKKEMMQVAKLSIFLIFIVPMHTCVAQSLEGVYEGDNGFIYYFKQDSFKTVSVGGITVHSTKI